MATLQNVYSQIETIKSELEPKTHAESRKLLMVQSKLTELQKYLEKIEHLDLQLQENVKLLSAKAGDTYEKEEFARSLDKIPADNILIYFMDAEIIRAYGPEEFDTSLINHLNSNFRTARTAEVIRENYPQKLYVMVEGSEGHLRPDIQKIKNYIAGTVKKMSEQVITNKEIVVFEDDNKTKFLAVSVTLPDYMARQTFLEQLERDMNANGDAEIAKKLQIREPSEIRGVRFASLPKVGNFINTASAFVTGPPVIININTFTHIVNDNSVHIDNSINISDSTVILAQKSVDEFCQEIYDNRPTWYKPGEEVSINAIEKAYRDYFGETISTSSSISKKLNGRIFDNRKKTRKHGVSTKKLFTWTELRDANDL